jgi:predicted amidohydrolase YtcJ
VTALDLMLRGGAVHRPGADRPVRAAIGIADGVIVAVGAERDVGSLAGAHTDVLDVTGATVVPGLVDAHTHPLLGVANTAGAELTQCTTREQVVAALRSVPAVDGWVRGWGLNPAVAIDRTVLDEAGAGRPAYVMLFDGHAAVGSSAALERAGVSGPVAFSSGAAVVCDGGGRPTGLLLEEAAIDLVSAVLPPLSEDRRREALAELLREMAATGLTGGHVMDLEPDDLAVYRALDEAGQLSLRLRLLPWCRPEDDDERLADLVALQRHHGRTWDVGGVKLFLDGTIDAGTAWLREPDCHGESIRPYWPDPQRYRRAVHRLAGAGVATATHAIGDAAVTFVLDTIAGARSLPTPHRVEHLETVSDDQLSRFAELGVIASMQPTHATDFTDADGSDNWSRRLGPQRVRHGWRCADLIAAGATLALGSDWPVAHYDPRAIMAAACTRRRSYEPSRPPVGADQALTVPQALAGYTRGAARAAGEQHRSGRIATGHRADLTVLTEDPLELHGADLAQVPVVATVMDGVVRFRSEQ